MDRENTNLEDVEQSLKQLILETESKVKLSKSELDELEKDIEKLMHDAIDVTALDRTKATSSYPSAFDRAHFHVALSATSPAATDSIANHRRTLTGQGSIFQSFQSAPLSGDLAYDESRTTKEMFPPNPRDWDDLWHKWK